MTFQRGNRRASKLTGEQVLKIRQMYFTGLYSYGKLGVIFDVSLNTISNIVNGYTWRHVAGVELTGLDKPPPNMVQGQEVPDEVIQESQRKLMEKLQLGILQEIKPSVGQELDDLINDKGD